MIKKHVLKCAGMTCAVLCLGVSAISARASESFSLDDIHYWIGEGTNRAGIVLDWNNGLSNSSLAWGYRWDGEAPNLTTVLKQMAHRDNRLHFASTGQGEGTWLSGFCYDVLNDSPVFEPMVAPYSTCPYAFVTLTDPDAEYWSVISIPESVITEDTSWDYAQAGINGVFVENGGWFAFKRINWKLWEDATPAVPVYAESPYAFNVVDYNVGKTGHSNPEAALGAPSVWVEGDFFGTKPGPVTPGAPAWGNHQLLSLARNSDGTGGWIILEFDHRVMDHPNNPFGQDFIVFGNCFQVLGGGSFFSPTGDPETMVFQSPNMFEEPAIVSVSQDGETWFTFEDGPFGDTFAPTMSHLYDTNNYDSSLFNGNKWWGKLADPTFPVDPAITSTNFVGKTLAEYATLYNGSAGGTAFDISGFDLERDEHTGHKWIRYVKLQSVSITGDWAEIDAVAAVSPALPYDNWVRENYSWEDQVKEEVVAKTALSENGKPNFYNAAFGTAPDQNPVESFAISNFSMDNGRATFTIPSDARAYDAFRISVATSVDGEYEDQLPTFKGEVQTMRGIESVFSIPINENDDAVFYKVNISAE